MLELLERQTPTVPGSNAITKGGQELKVLLETEEDEGIDFASCSIWIKGRQASGFGSTTDYGYTLRESQVYALAMALENLEFDEDEQPNGYKLTRELKSLRQALILDTPSSGRSWLGIAQQNGWSIR